ncbi:MAG: DUF2058 family protein [Candidatus Tectimicrobiota bacterium]
MPDLRDQLLKAGLINKGQQKQVELEKRRERKQLKKGQAEELALAQQRQAYEAKLEAQRQEDRQRAAQQREAHEAREKLLRLRHIIDYWKLSEEPSGTRRWYFVTRHNVVKYLYVSSQQALRLSTGMLAVAERPDEREETRYVLLERDAVDLLQRVDPTYLRFHNSTFDAANDE